MAILALRTVVAEQAGGGARPAGGAGRGEAGPLVRAIAERLDAGLAAPAERDGRPARVDFGPVLVDQPEVTAHDQRAVPVGRDRGARPPAAWLGLLGERGPDVIR